MQLTETVKLYMTKEQRCLVVTTMNAYISTVNSLVSAAVNGASISKYTTADVDASQRYSVKGGFKPLLQNSCEMIFLR